MNSSIWVTEPMHRISADIKLSIWKQLKKRAVDNETTVGAVVREVLRKWYEALPEETKVRI